MDNWSVIAASVAAILVMLVSLAVVDARMLPAAPWPRSVLLSLACAATGSLAWLALAPHIAPAVVGPLFLPMTALAGLAAYLPSIVVRAGGGGVVGSLVFALVWSAIVLVPTAILTFDFFNIEGPFSIEPVDHGGSLLINVASGAAALGVLVASGKGGPRMRTATIGKGAATVAMVTLCIGWLAWLATAEMAIDDVIPSILTNGVVSALAGVGGWLVVQRVLHQSTTRAAVAGGLVSGLVAITAGAALFVPLSAAVVGFIAGAAACLVTLLQVRSTRRQQWFIVGSHFVAGAIGVTSLGIFAIGTGYFFTGDPGFTLTGEFSLLERQIVSTVVVAAYSFLVSFGLWHFIKGVAPVRVAQP